MGKLFTIGCSIHTPENFLSLLKNNNINVVADVRSTPFSKHTPQFNQDILRDFLAEKKINYIHFGDEFGAKRKEKEVYIDGKVDFKKVVKLPVFLKGVERIEKGMQKDYNIALLCTEKNPLDCHRFLLVSKALNNLLNINISHILFDGNVLEQHGLENQMLNLLNLTSDLFIDRNILVENAYTKLGEKIACQEKESVYE
jgi:uncharacterized protein (DUF488 family)